MSYLFQTILLVFALACALLVEAFWSWSNLNLSNSFYTWIAAGSAFVIYAGADYLMLNYLMLIPGNVYVIA